MDPRSGLAARLLHASEDQVKTMGGVMMVAETSTRPAKYANKHSRATSMVKVETCFNFTPRLGATSINAALRIAACVFFVLPVRRVPVLVRAIVFSRRQSELQLRRLPGLRKRGAFRA